MAALWPFTSVMGMGDAKALRAAIVERLDKLVAKEQADAHEPDSTDSEGKVYDDSATQQ